MLLAVALLATNTFPKFTAKFVETPNGGHPDLIDAEPDLRASGSTFLRMVDVIPRNPLLIWKGRMIPLEDYEGDHRIFPNTIIDQDHVYASKEREGTDDKVTHLKLTLRGSRIRRQERIKPLLSPPAKSLEPTYSEGDKVSAAIINQWRTKQTFKVHEGSYRWRNYPPRHGYQIASINYYPVLPGYEDAEMHDSDLELPVIKRNNEVRPLSDCITNLKSLDLREIAWVPKKGKWLIVTGVYKNKGGFFWLYQQ